ncbi:hypothetical protein K443DRAFT_684900 [Laccaria amethystina LaAM-08-1]|uniref:Phospholipid scramblase n=1 Tax=Laccaria amethystina LaAM-08-1 TaxID=1095629 RepID=A0A0C9WIH3_9AGAR|nr:hypothetical protein K443DRAFT_684900 [Laccaria amethystina LaAM-08-1]
MSQKITACKIVPWTLTLDVKLVHHDEARRSRLAVSQTRPEIKELHPFDLFCTSAFKASRGGLHNIYVSPPNSARSSFAISRVLNAKIRTTHDDTVIYSVTTSEGLWGRRYTFLKDANPALGDSTTVGVIHWNEKILEVCGHKKSLKDIRRKPQGLIRERYWRWSSDRREFVIDFQEDEWKVKINNSKNVTVEGSFDVPYRPRLFGKTTPMVFHLSRKALAKDEVFLILVLIYSESKRQEKMNSAVGW